MNFNPTINRITENSIKEPQHQDHDEPNLDKPRCDWNFNLCTVISSSSSSNSSISDTLGAAEFDPSGNLLATAGIARKIRIYSLKSLLPHDITTATQHSSPAILDHTTACDFYICTPAKLSSLKWKPNTNSRIIASGDYDGVVTEYDLERKLPVFERDEHSGRRVWSIDYINNNNNNNNNPVVGASGSDDGTVQLWDTRCYNGSLVGMITPNELTRSAVCCVEFSPFSEELLAIGCADRNAYTYDVRRLASPVRVFVGHEKTVSYVRFMGERRMVSAGIDECLKLWDLEEAREVRSYKGHVNRRNFVGLAVMKKGGLVGCGSESGEIFVYDERWGEPIWVCGLMEGYGGGGDGNSNKERRFVGSVCWREEGEHECKLVAGGSDGVLQVFSGRRRRLVDY